MIRTFLILGGLAFVVAGGFWLRNLIRPRMERVGIELLEMKDELNEFMVKREARGQTTEQKLALQHSVARSMFRHRTHLLRLVDEQKSENVFETRLRKFLDTWATEDAYFKSLDQDRSDDGFGSELTGLTFLVPDKRWQWKTLFPIFRP